MNAVLKAVHTFRRYASHSLHAKAHPELALERTHEASEIKAGNDYQNKTVFGFWTYLMTDCVLFASLFATYGVLRNNVNGGPGGSELFSLPYVLVETVLLLTSSFTSGLALLAVRRSNKNQIIGWLIVTFLLGASFLSMELHEFSNLVHEGHSWQSSGFLTAFFTLVGTHGAHITVGLIWMITLIIVTAKRGVTSLLTKRLTLLIMFWHLLDVVWIFIFTIVYLLGAV